MEKIQLSEPHYFFIKKDFRLEDSYKKFFSVENIFIEYNAGIATGKDKVLVDFQRENLARRLSVRDKETFYLLMKVEGIEKKLIDKWYQELNGKDIKEQIISYAYRPFDKRFTIYNEKILQRARKTIMDHLLSDNLSIVLTKQLAKLPFAHCFVSTEIGDRCLVSLRTKELGYFFPLYLYKAKKDNPSKKHSFSTLMMLFEPSADYFVKKPNLSQTLVEQLTKEFKKTPTPEQIFYYIYAVLYSNTYRTKYAEFLKIDFPRIPFTKDYKSFKKIGEYGERLVDLHLLKLIHLLQSYRARVIIRLKN